MCCGIDHAPSAATGAEPSVLAGKRHQQFVAAAGALDAHEPVHQATAFQVIVKLLKRELRQKMTAFSQMLGDLRRMVLNDLVQQRQFRPVSNVWRGRDVGQGGSQSSWTVNVGLFCQEMLSVICVVRCGLVEAAG